MKNLIRAAGALSLGAASLALSNCALASEGGEKPWTASASLRGFYDDNIFTSNAAEISSWGFDVSPSLTYGRTVDNTTFDIGYTYVARWFENRPGSSWDQNHNASFNLEHVFSPRVKTSVSDVFVSAQDPQQALIGQVLRAEGDNINNSAAANVSLAVSEQLDATLSYRNNFFDYSSPLFSNSLNRVEHLPTLEFNYLTTPSTSVGLGYQFGIFDYDFAGLSRDYNSHVVYAGVRHNFTQSFFGSVNIGAQITDYDAAASDTTPYLDGKLVYQYTTASEVVLNVRHTLNATDVFLDGAGNLLAANQQTTMFRVSWGHAFTAKIKGTLIGQFQNSEFNGGAADGGSETFWTLGASASYALTPHLALDASYFRDSLNSDPTALGYDRGYERNRVFLGVRASF